MTPDTHSPEFWIDRWRESEKGDTETIGKGYATAEYWDSLADSYDKRFDESVVQSHTDLADSFEADGMLLSGMEVLDIGCGTGRLAIEMAKRGARVTATDISPAMLAKVTAHTPPDLAGSITVVPLDWRKADIGKLGWERRFGLVTANMTPALNTPETLEAMIRASRGGCYLKIWAEKYASPVVRDLWSTFAGRELSDRKAPFLYILNLLITRGFHPSVRFEKMASNRGTQAAELIKTTTVYFEGIFGDTIPDIEEKVTERINKLAVDGMVYETISGWAASLFWTFME